MKCTQNVQKLASRIAMSGAFDVGASGLAGEEGDEELVQVGEAEVLPPAAQNQVLLVVGR